MYLRNILKRVKKGAHLLGAPGRKEKLQRLHQVERSLKAHLDELTALYEVSKSITSATNLEKLLALIVKKVARIMHSDICIIYLLKNGGLTIKTSYGIKNSIKKSKAQFFSLKRCLVGDVIRDKKAVRIDDMSSYSRDAIYSVCRRSSLRSLLVVPLIEKGEAIRSLCICSAHRAHYTKADEKELALFASQAAVAIENSRLFEETRVNYLNTMKLLASVIDAKDTCTEDHSERVMHSALAIARALRLSDRQRSVIKYASLLHDIGKIGIDISILRKPAPLTKEEWAEMKKHPKTGADIIKKAGFLDDLVPIILYHHVRYEGGGYPPTRKKREAIPIEARILAVADAFEAMRSDRPYRTHLSIENAVGELKKCRGTQFDPKVVDAFLRLLLPRRRSASKGR